MAPLRVHRFEWKYGQEYSALAFLRDYLVLPAREYWLDRLILDR